MSGSLDCIKDKYNEIYYGKNPKSYATIRKRNEGGAYLDEIEIYDVGEFWHYISYGMSELYEKESSDDKVSGWGYEYSFKLKKGTESEPPLWVVTPLQKLARYVFNQCTPFGEAHFVNFGAAIEPDLNENLNSFIFSFDPTVGVINTPTGCLNMLEIFCISQKDIDYCFSSESASCKLVDTIRNINLGFVNDFSQSIDYCDYI